MLRKDIESKWQSNRIDAVSAVEWWNFKAGSFAFQDLPTGKESIALRLIEQNNMLKEGNTTLDVGCGAGKYSFALEKMGSIATGTDFSPNMVDECKKAKERLSSKAEFVVSDWLNVNIKDMGWEKKFDLVLANTTPAICSAETVLKLCDASRNWCVMVKPVRRRDNVIDALREKLGLISEEEMLTQSTKHIFETLWLSGYSPKAEYEDRLWEKTWSAEDAIKEYTLRFSSNNVLSDDDKQLIAQYINSISRDGKIKETMNSTLIAVYWQVK